MTASIMPDTIPEARDLPNKPLAEAIFEVRWALSQQSGPMAVDPGFQLLLGRYYDRIRKTFPTAIALPASTVPENMTAHTVRQQFRKGKDKWPLTQIGPGILTVNDVAGYKWETFRPLLKEALAALFDAYPTDVAPLRPVQALLRYINVIAFDPTTSAIPLLDFFREKLHTQITPEPLLFRAPEEAASPTNLSLNLSYRITDPDAKAGMSFALGEANGNPAIILEIVVQTVSDHIPKTLDEFDSWLSSAHDNVIDKWFFALVRGDLLKEYEKTP